MHIGDDEPKPKIDMKGSAGDFSNTAWDAMLNANSNNKTGRSRSISSTPQYPNITLTRPMQIMSYVVTLIHKQRVSMKRIKWFQTTIQAPYQH
jgi:hypothetical protein